MHKHHIYSRIGGGGSIYLYIVLGSSYPSNQRVRKAASLREILRREGILIRQHLSAVGLVTVGMMRTSMIMVLVPEIHRCYLAVVKRAAQGCYGMTEVVGLNLIYSETRRVAYT